MLPGVQLHNKLNWINKNTERESFHFPIPFFITNLSQEFHSLLYQHRQNNSHNVSWFNAVAWQNMQVCVCVCVHIYHQHSLDRTIFYIFSDLDQCSETSGAIHSKQIVGISSKEEETASSTGHRKWLTQLILIVKPQSWKEFSSSNILLHHNDKPTLPYTSKITCTCFQARFKKTEWPKPYIK